MNASKAKRRWLAWCRYVDTTGTQANRSRGWGHQRPQRPGQGVCGRWVIRGMGRWWENRG